MTNNKPSIFGPEFVQDKGLQISAHECNKFLEKDLKSLFPDQDLSNLIAIITMQHSKHDLVEFGCEIDQEKDDLLESVSFII
jgi:hypothetical protein